METSNLHCEASIIQNDQIILTTKLYEITLLLYFPDFFPPPHLFPHVATDHK